MEDFSLGCHECFWTAFEAFQAGASAPEILVQQVIDRIKALGAVSVRKMDGIEETVKFPLPKGLKLDA